MISNWGSDDESLTASPRSNMVYNIYYNVYNVSFKDNLFPFAVRTNNTLSSWYNFKEAYANDDDFSRCECSHDIAVCGDYDQFLFDLDEEDPNETINLFESTIEKYVAAKASLKVFMSTKLTSVAYDNYGSTSASEGIYSLWASYDDFIVPWSYSGSISYCSKYTYIHENYAIDSSLYSFLQLYLFV
jgi:hypothetical protein